MVELVGRRDVDDPHGVVGEELVERRVGLREAQLRRAAAARSGDDSRRPATRTPIRRSASMWTVPMKPLPMTAVAISLRRVMAGG